jgi:hypothetical protein
MAYPTIGDHALSGVATLPNVNLAFPGEHWSDRCASGAIVPGEAIIPVASGLGASAKLAMKVAGAGDSAEKDRIAIALRPVDVPDSNVGPGSLGPNEIRNQVIPHGEYVHAYYSGVFHLTLVTPAAYVPGDRIGWDADGVRPAGKSGAGTWAKDASADIDSIFEVVMFRPVNVLNEGILTVRWIGRGQF